MQAWQHIWYITSLEGVKQIFAISYEEKRWWSFILCASYDWQYYVNNFPNCIYSWKGIFNIQSSILKTTKEMKITKTRNHKISACPLFYFKGIQSTKHYWKAKFKKQILFGNISVFTQFSFDLQPTMPLLTARQAEWLLSLYGYWKYLMPSCPLPKQPIILQGFRDNLMPVSENVSGFHLWAADASSCNGKISLDWAECWNVNFVTIQRDVKIGDKGIWRENQIFMDQSGISHTRMMQHE